VIKLVAVVVLAVLLQTSAPVVVTGHVTQKLHKPAHFTQVEQNVCLVGDGYYVCPTHLYPQYKPDTWHLKLCDYTRTVCRWVQVGALTWHTVQVNTYYDSRNYYNPPY
jgi:hypothetical protein